MLGELNASHTGCRYYTTPKYNFGMLGVIYDDGWKGDGLSPCVMHRLSMALVVLGVLIGISRLYLGMHYPSDVICGLLLGMIVATIVYRIILRIEDKRGMMDSWLSRDQGITK